MIRWKKRLKGWAMFVGTSRKASGWVIVDRKSRWVTARMPDNKAWLRAPSVAEAKAWCENMPANGWSHVIDEMIAVLVLPDGTVERRAVERTASIEMHWQHQRVRKHTATSSAQYMPIERVVLRGRVFAICDADPITGDYIQWRLMAYSTPEYNGVAEIYAREELEEVRRKHRIAHLRGQAKPVNFGHDYTGLSLYF